MHRDMGHVRTSARVQRLGRWWPGLQADSVAALLVGVLEKSKFARLRLGQRPVLDRFEDLCSERTREPCSKSRPLDVAYRHGYITKSAPVKLATYRDTAGRSSSYAGCGAR